MKVAVSSCLLGINCKYSGGNNYHDELNRWLKDHEITAVCPEVLGGLPVPRASCEIRNEKVKTKSGDDKTKEYRRGAENALAQVRENGCELVILQARSPSCGVCHIYDGTFSKKLIEGSGIFARMLREQGIPALDTENIESIGFVLNGKENSVKR